MKLSVSTATATAAAATAIASGQPALAIFSGSSNTLDLSKDLEDAPSLNKSSGALTVIEAAESDPAIRTAMVLEDGKVVASYVRDGVDPDDPYIVHSVTKSVTSLLIGILLDEGALSSLDETLGDVFNDESIWDDVPDVEFRKAITIKEMLTMTSGLLYNGHSADICNGLTAWLSEPLIGPKGKFDYLVVSDILTYVIVERIGMTPRQLLADKVLKPLGIQDSEIGWALWECPDDQPERAFGGLELTSMQMAKIGLLYLAQGAAGPDERVVSAEYVDESLTEHVIIETFQWSDPEANADLVGLGYGYLWYKDFISFEGVENWCASGMGGQFICIDEAQGRVTVQERDDDEPTGFMTPSYVWPALVALNPSLSFEGAELDISSGSDTSVKSW